MFNNSRPEVVKTTKIKINIELGYAKKILFAIGFFILVDSVFLFVRISNVSSGTIDKLIVQGYSDESAKVLSMFSLFGTYIIDWVVMIIFLVSVMLGRRRTELGNFFNYCWMIILLVLAIFPFATPAATNIDFIKTGVLLMPLIYMIYIMLQQTNDLRWVRKAVKIKESRGKYV